MTPSVFLSGVALSGVAMDIRVAKSLSRISLVIYRVLVTLCLYVTWVPIGGTDLPLVDMRGVYCLPS